MSLNTSTAGELSRSLSQALSVRDRKNSRGSRPSTPTFAVPSPKAQKPPPISSLGREKLAQLGIDIWPIPPAMKDDSARSGRKASDACLGLHYVPKLENLKKRSMSPCPPRVAKRPPPLSSLPKKKLEGLGIDVHPVPEVLRASLEQPNPLISRGVNLHSRTFAYLIPKRREEGQKMSDERRLPDLTTLTTTSSITRKRSVSAPETESELSAICGGIGAEIHPQAHYGLSPVLRSAAAQNDLLASVKDILKDHRRRVYLRKKRMELIKNQSQVNLEVTSETHRVSRCNKTLSCLFPFLRHDPPLNGEITVDQSQDVELLKLGYNWRQPWRDRDLVEYEPRGARFLIPPEVGIRVTGVGVFEDVEEKRISVAIVPSEDAEARLSPVPPLQIKVGAQKAKETEVEMRKKKAFNVFQRKKQTRSEIGEEKAIAKLRPTKSDNKVRK